MLCPDDLRGKLIPAVPVPFDRDGRDPSRGARAIRRPPGGTAGRGSCGLGAHGRGLWLSEAERGAILTAWRAGTAGGSVRDRLGRLCARASAIPSSSSPVRGRWPARPPTWGPMRSWSIPRSPSAAAPTRTAWSSAITRRSPRRGCRSCSSTSIRRRGGSPTVRTCSPSCWRRPEVLGIKVATLDSVMTFQQIARLVAYPCPGQAADHRRGSLPRLQPDVRRRCGPDRHGSRLHGASRRVLAELLVGRRRPLPRFESAPSTTWRSTPSWPRWRATSCGCSGAWSTRASSPPRPRTTRGARRLGPAEFDQIGACLARLPRE